MEIYPIGHALLDTCRVGTRLPIIDTSENAPKRYTPTNYIRVIIIRERNIGNTIASKRIPLVRFNSVNKVEKRKFTYVSFTGVVEEIVSE